jgi:hypothetical protein
MLRQVPYKIAFGHGFPLSNDISIKFPCSRNELIGFTWLNEFRATRLNNLIRYARHTDAAFFRQLCACCQLLMLSTTSTEFERGPIEIMSREIFDVDSGDFQACGALVPLMYAQSLRGE